MDRIAIRAFIAADAASASLLVREVFDAFVAIDCTPEGRRAFHEFAAPERLRERLANGHFGYIAAAENTLAGVLMVSEPAHLLMLFVRPAFHRRGIAKRLLALALAHIHKASVRVAAMTVNASPYAVKAYRHLGFELDGPSLVKNGISCVPMRLVLTDSFWTRAFP